MKTYSRDFKGEVRNILPVRYLTQKDDRIKFVICKTILKFS